MSEIIRQLTGVGPRLVSPSVRAAEKLPSSTKIESVKNQLLRHGAKPVELEYARLDNFLEGKEGGRIAADDVAEHLRRQGPLGRLERHDAEGPDQESLLSDMADDRGIDFDDPESPLTVQDYFPEQPRLSSDPAFPTGRGNPKAPVTRYPSVTEVAAFPWSDADYNEVLWKQRASPATGLPTFGEASVVEAYDPHDAHMWVRYHMNRDAIDVQNVQSDLGQLLTRHDRAGLPPEGWRDQRRRIDDLVSRIEAEAPDDDIPMSPEAIWRTGATVDAARKLAGRFYDSFPIEWLQSSPRTYIDPSLITLLENDNWRQIPLRHLLLESAARGGRPIRFPTGHNVNRVEYMPSRAAQKMYERDLPNAMMKILKPIGGGERTFNPIVRTTGGIGVGARGSRAGTTITPSMQAVEHIKKHGLDFLSLLMLTGAGVASQQEQKK
jgi:hypothetical protein